MRFLDHIPDNEWHVIPCGILTVSMISFIIETLLSTILKSYQNLFIITFFIGHSMAAVKFDQPSTGTVNSNSGALTITNSGGGSALNCNTNNNAVVITAVNDNMHGIWAESKKGGVGVLAFAKSNHAIMATSTSDSATINAVNTSTGPGIFVKSTGEALKAETNSPTSAVIGATNHTGIGIWAESKAGGIGVVGRSLNGVGIQGEGGRLAGYFRGDVEVTGDIRLINADCAEEFDVEGEVEPGTVMVINDHGTLESSRVSYDKKVAGIISGAGGFKPGIVLDKQKQKSGTTRMAIALLGKVYCKVDATLSSIEIGDLLTTSPTMGHAMKANDPLNAFGATIGKALQPLKYGKGMIPVLVALQ